MQISLTGNSQKKGLKAAAYAHEMQALKSFQKQARNLNPFRKKALWNTIFKNIHKHYPILLFLYYDIELCE